MRGTVFSVAPSGVVSCRKADQVIEAFMSGKGKLHGPRNGPAALQTWTVDGWSCGRGAGEDACRLGGSATKNARAYVYAQAICGPLMRPHCRPVSPAKRKTP